MGVSKMDGENNGSKPYEQMEDLGGNNPPLFLAQHPPQINPIHLSHEKTLLLSIILVV